MVCGLFEWVCETEPPTRPDLMHVRHQIGVMSKLATAYLIPDNHVGRATVSSVAVAHEVDRMGGRAIACLNARDRNALGFQRDLLTSAAYGVDEFLFVYGDDPTSGGRTGQLTVRSMIDQLRQERIPVFAIHGDRDIAVPMATAKDTARRTRGDLVVVKGGSHSWLLKDPETLPAIMHALMRGRLGTAVLRAQLERGVDPVDATDDEVEAALYAPDALVLELTPRQRIHDTEDLHRPPRYTWKVLAARSKGD